MMILEELKRQKVANEDMEVTIRTSWPESVSDWIHGSKSKDFFRKKAQEIHQD